MWCNYLGCWWRIVQCSQLDEKNEKIPAKQIQQEPKRYPSTGKVFLVHNLQETHTKMSSLQFPVSACHHPPPPTQTTIHASRMTYLPFSCVSLSSLSVEGSVLPCQLTAGGGGEGAKYFDKKTILECGLLISCLIEVSGNLWTHWGEPDGLNNWSSDQNHQKEYIYFFIFIFLYIFGTGYSVLTIPLLVLPPFCYF